MVCLNTVAALLNVFFSLPLSEGMIFYYAFDNFWLVFNQVKLNIPVKKYLRINEIETHWLLFCVRIHFITHSKSHIIWLPCRMLVITIDWHVHFSREIDAWLCRIKPNIPSNCLLLDLFVLNKIVNHFFSVEYLLSSLNLRQFSLYHFECSLVRLNITWLKYFAHTDSHYACYRTHFFFASIPRNAYCDDLLTRI